MSPEAQRIAIAEACGWTEVTARMFIDVSGRQVTHGKDLAPVPDYLSDLNAMYEAEKVLTVPQRLTYYKTLVDMLDRNPDGSHRFGACVYWETLHATAAQRAEAFLRTIGKWDDTK